MIFYYLRDAPPAAFDAYDVVCQAEDRSYGRPLRLSAPCLSAAMPRYATIRFIECEVRYERMRKRYFRHLCGASRDYDATCCAISLFRYAICYALYDDTLFGFAMIFLRDSACCRAKDYHAR